MAVPHEVVSASGEGALVVVARVPVSVDIVVMLVARVAANDVVVTVSSVTSTS